MVGLWPGVETDWSRRIRVPSTAAADPAGTVNTWHLLDNGPQLAARGAQPAGTLLCVHGNPTWSYLWRSLLAAGSGRERPWRVIAVDQLDMGFSSRTGTFRRLADRITDLDDLTEVVDLQGPVVTVGHDWGGIISLGWAHQHRNLLAGVVLTNTAVHPAGYGLPAPLRLALHPAVHRWGTTTTDAFLRVTHSLARPALADDVRRAYLAPYRSAARRAGVGNFVADIPAGPSHPSWPALAATAEGIRSLNVPALMLWGPQDPVFSDRYLRDLLDRMPQADVHRFEGAGHLLPEDVDIAVPVFDWLEQKLPPAEAPARELPAPETAPAPAPEAAAQQADPAAAGSGPAFVPLLAELDSRAADSSPAVVDMVPADGAAGPSVLSWAELAARVDRLAAGLAAIGVRPGARVSLLVPPGSQLTALIYACLRLGAVIVVADAGLGSQGLSRAVRGAGPSFIIGIGKALAAARIFGWPGVKVSAAGLPPAARRALDVQHTLPELLASSGEVPAYRPDPEAEAAVLFTSGSTGPAKGVVYRHRQLAAMRDALRTTYGLHAGTSLVAGFAPFALLGPALGATSVTPDMDVTRPKTLTAAALANAAAAVSATAVFASPAALKNVLATAGELDARQRGALAGVDLLLSAGAPIPEPLLAQVQELLPQASLHTPYGMTEALPVTDISLDGIRRAGAGNGVCVGTPVAGAQVAISPLAADGRPAADMTTDPGVTGEIVVSAPHVKDRYDRLWITQAQSASLPGWHRTGDVGHLDTAGRLWVEGRLGHILTTAGGVRTPVAAEQLAGMVDGVRLAAVVGVGPAGAQVPVAVVETIPAASAPGPAPAELSARVRGAVRSAHLDLAAVLAVPQLPTDIRHNSKIDRSRLAAWAAAALSGGRISAP